MGLFYRMMDLVAAVPTYALGLLVLIAGAVCLVAIYNGRFGIALLAYLATLITAIWGVGKILGELIARCSLPLN